MIRRSFRFGLLLGLLGGAAFAVTKVFGGRPPQHLALATPVSTEPWPRLPADPTVAAAPIARPVPDPAAPVAPPVVAPPVPAAPEPLRVPEPLPLVTAALPPDPVPAEPAPRTAAPKPKASAPRKPKAPPKAWVAPNGGVCPTSHPVKAKLASKIFHLPGMLNYARTNPDRCYLDAEQAEADGLRASKR